MYCRRILSFQRKVFPDWFFSSQILKIKRIYFTRRKKAVSNEERHELDQEEAWEVNTLYDEWNMERSSKLVNCAHKYDLVIPQVYKNGKLKDCWEKSLQYGDKICLSSKGRSIIKKQYRREKQWKRQTISLFLSLLIGIIGAVTGLLALLFHKIY